MWHLREVLLGYQLWFSDGLPIDAIRGGHGVSSRLIVDRKGFLDVTEVRSAEAVAINANGETLWMKKLDKNNHPACPSLENSSYPLNLSLEDGLNGGFKLSLTKLPDVLTTCYNISNPVSGQFKPLPEISPADAAFLDQMIEEKFVPYQNITDAPQKPVEEIRALGKQYFPWTPYSFQLAMCIYDWTSASYMRFVFLKIFQYTGINSHRHPHPLDMKNFMNSILMKPADSLANLTTQLDSVIDRLYDLSEVQNRLLAAAMRSMPRTSAVSKPQLFSGQVDIYQLGVEHFGIEFYECPLNKGPIGEQLEYPLTQTLSTFASVGSTITTKMVWSFADSLPAAFHYSNGIVLSVSLPADAWVWDEINYITPMSDDDKKYEYVFAPGTQFEIKSIDQANVEGKVVTVISLEPKSSKPKSLKARSTLLKVNQQLLAGAEVARLVEKHITPVELPHSQNKMAGRRCACYDA
ncbi:hypothetical protein PT974_10344 [Cladobotryum mycophilum]|uniref:Uncharacterized protein n=1 Tax=Cladobotryum mycophilum TaxID=491253 RepID=A0ABR0S9K1_9HYPO